MPGRLVDHARARARLMLLAAAAALVAGCSSTPAPTPYSPSPAPAAVSVPPAGSSPAATSPTDSKEPGPIGSPVKSSPGQPPELALRTTYAGIKKLVIVDSNENKTAAGIIALNTVAAYFGSLSRATQQHDTAAAVRLASPTCNQCRVDLDRIRGYIERGEVVRSSSGGPGDWKSLALFIRVPADRGKVVVFVDGVDPALQLVDRGGHVVGQDPGGLVSLYVSVDVRGASGIVSSIESR